MNTVDKFIEWKGRRIRHQYFVMLLAALAGLLSGAIAVTLKNVVHLIQYLFRSDAIKDYHQYFYFAFPLIGILLTRLVIKYIVRRPVTHGMANMLYAISKRNGNVSRHNLFSSFITSILTVGFGASAGLEGPTVATSAAFGSNIGRKLKLSYKTKVLLIGCAASGAMAALLNAPVAALVFAIEVFMLDLTVASMIPLLIASATAAISSRLMLGDDVLFHTTVDQAFHISEIPFFLALGVAGGLGSVYFSKLYFYLQKVFSRFENPFVRAIIGGSLLGGLIFVFPPLYGEGYQVVNLLIDGMPEKVLGNTLFSDAIYQPILLALFFLGAALLKGLATTLTISAGGIGGIFAPTMMMGSMLGFGVAQTINLFRVNTVSSANFTLVGMAAMMSGVLYAPLTAIFLIAEITGGYGLFIPLMITCAVAYVTARYFQPHSIYTMQLAKRGELITHDKDQAVLTLMKLHKEIETDFDCIEPGMSLGELTEVVARSSRNLYPVLDSDGRFLGVVFLDDIRGIMFNQVMHDYTYVSSLMKTFSTQVSNSDSMDTVMEKFESSGAWNLPVVDDGKYVGFVSKSKLFNAYRNLLQEFYQEEQ